MLTSYFDEDVFNESPIKYDILINKYTTFV